MAQNNRDQYHQLPASMSSAEAPAQASTAGPGDGSEQHVFAPQAYRPPVPLSLEPNLFAQGPNAPYAPQQLPQHANAPQQTPDQQFGLDLFLSPIEFPEDPSLPGIAGSGMTLTGPIGQGMVHPRGENIHHTTYESVRNQLYGDNYAPANFLTSTTFRLAGQPLWGQRASPFIPGAPLENVPQNPAAANEYLDRQILWRPSAHLARVPHPFDTDRIRWYGNEIANALADVSTAADRAIYPAQYQRFLPVEQGGLWTWPRIVAIAHQVVGIAIRLHEVGTTNSAFYDPTMRPTGAEEAMNFHDRINAFINLVKTFKACADMIMHQNYIEQYLATPVRIMNIKQQQIQGHNAQRRQGQQAANQQTHRPASGTQGHPPMTRAAQHAQDRESMRRRHPPPTNVLASPHPRMMPPMGSSHIGSGITAGGFSFNDFPGPSSSAPVQQSPFGPPQEQRPTNAYFEAGYRPTGFMGEGETAQPRRAGINASWYNPAFGLFNTFRAGSTAARQGQQLGSGLASSQEPTVAGPSMTGSAESEAGPSRFQQDFDMSLEFLQDMDEETPTTTAG